MDDLARQKLIATLKLEDQARKLAAKNPFNQAEIWEKEASAAARVSAQMDETAKATHSWAAGASEAFSKYKDDAEDAAKFAKNFIDGSLNKMTDALTTFVMTGKLSFKDLFNFMAEEFIRQQIKMQMAQFLPGGSSGGMLAGLFGGAAAGGAAAGGSAELFAEAPMFAATGINYVPKDNMPFILHEGEAVVPKAYNPAAGGGGGGHTVTIHQTNNIGDGVSRSEVWAAMVQAKDAAKVEILQSIKHRGVYAR